MIDRKLFGGILNKDDREISILSIQHIDALNIRFFGGQNGLVAQNVKGNYKITNSLLPAGTNECIGAIFDEVNQRILFFIFNSNGNSSIFQLSIQTELVTPVFICGTNSATDIFEFSRDYPIHSAVIVYRPEGDGDLLYWVQGNRRPSYLNLGTVAALQPFTQDMINAAKMPIPVPPTVAYSSDATKNYNNVKNRYFRFSTLPVYANNEPGTLSPVSDLPLPPSIVQPEINVAPNTNNLITVSVISGTTSDFKKLEIYFQEFDGTSWGDFLLATVLDTDDIGAIPWTHTFNFYNDGIYPPMTRGKILNGEFVPLSDLRFSYVPDLANTLELLNGNTIIYGGVSEGYTPLTRQEVNVQITVSTTTDNTTPVIPVWKWANNERLGLIYFDKRGKTNGVISFLADAVIDTTNFDVTTPQCPAQTATSSGARPKLSASINHLPPSWAATYQWVRLDLAPPFFLQFITNDYQFDTDYIYLCIQSLITANTRDGFIPSYEFVEGDRVRIIANYIFPTTPGPNLTAVFSTQFDFQILEVVERTMNGSTYNPAETGAFLKCKKPATFPTPAYTSLMEIEIYTPTKNNSEEADIYYEWGQEYAITGGFHTGQIQNQTGSQPALFEWTNGYVYKKYRIFPAVVQNLVIGSLYVQDRNYNDYQNSKANANSRGWPIDVNAKEEYFPGTSRWGQQYVQDTNINHLNIFFPEDLDTIDRSKGDIRRFKARDRILRVFQDRAVSQYGVYARFIQNNQGNKELVTTNEIITTNNINYYQGTVGLGAYPTNLCSSPIADYFTDIVTGREQRLAGDGITDLGIEYKGQFYFASLVTPYNKSILRTNGSIAKVMKFWDSFEGEAHTILQAGTGGGVTVVDYNYSFNEPRNAFCSFFSYIPEWALSANDIIFSWKNGEIYKHHSVNASAVAVPYCNWYGIQYDCFITLVFNINSLEKKTWESVTEVASAIWACPLIYSNVMSYGSQRQESLLVQQIFADLEGNFHAAIRRDANSRGGVVNGDWMKGNYLVVKFLKQNASDLIWLSEVSIRYVDSPLTVKQ